jgi:hypothetical protein
LQAYPVTVIIPGKLQKISGLSIPDFTKKRIANNRDSTESEGQGGTKKRMNG